MVEKGPLRPASGIWPIVDVGRALGFPIDERASEAIARWLDLLVQWNEKHDLTAARSSDELVDLMLADAIVLGKELEQGAHVIDVGTGAGAPGLGLGLLRPDLRVTLLEPLTKRVSFLRTVLGALGESSRLRVVQGRGEGTQAGTATVAISRATLAPSAWLELGARMVRGADAGSVWVLLAQGEAPALADWRIHRDRTYAWPLTGVTRRAVEYVVSVGGR